MRSPARRARAARTDAAVAARRPDSPSTGSTDALELGFIVAGGVLEPEAAAVPLPLSLAIVWIVELRVLRQAVLLLEFRDRLGGLLRAHLARRRGHLYRPCALSCCCAWRICCGDCCVSTAPFWAPFWAWPPMLCELVAPPVDGLVIPDDGVMPVLVGAAADGVVGIVDGLAEFLPGPSPTSERSCSRRSRRSKSVASFPPIEATRIRVLFLGNGTDASRFREKEPVKSR